ncbi:MAG TPA: Bax inhibitor-1 family protein [Pirellulales bacterium]
MSYAENPYRTWGTVAAQADTSERARFIRLTYLHLAGAVLAFMGLEAFLLSLPGVGEAVSAVLGARWGWVIVMAAFVGVSLIANSWASSSTSMVTQYLGLGLYVVAEAIIFVPLLYLAATFAPNGTQAIAMAGVLTLVVFTGLTGVVMLSGADFSFLRTTLCVAGFVALGVVICAAIFGFNLGILFTGAMILLACGYILYDTSNVLHHYQIGQHVAASLALFASVALLFWYILQLVLSLTSRD